MSKRWSRNPRVWPAHFLLAAGLVACIVWLALTLFRDLQPAASTRVPAAGTAKSTGVKPELNGGKPGGPRQLSGEQAREYLEHSGEGQSLMAAVTAVQFGLKWQERVLFDGDTGGGYLGMSHDQNLNAWFDEEGVTVRPTLAEKERDKAWQVGFRLKGYGYGQHLQPAPPVVARKVKDNRIEYQRAGPFCANSKRSLWRRRRGRRRHDPRRDAGREPSDCSLF